MEEGEFVTQLREDLDPRQCGECRGTGEGLYLGWSQGHEDCEACDGTGFRPEATTLLSRPGVVTFDLEAVFDPRSGEFGLAVRGRLATEDSKR